MHMPNLNLIYQAIFEILSGIQSVMTTEQTQSY